MDRLHDSLARGADDIIHFHGFNDQQFVAGGHLLAWPYRDRLDQPGKGGRDGIARDGYGGWSGGRGLGWTRGRDWTWDPGRTRG